MGVRDVGSYNVYRSPLNDSGASESSGGSTGPEQASESDALRTQNEAGLKPEPSVEKFLDILVFFRQLKPEFYKAIEAGVDLQETAGMVHDLDMDAVMAAVNQRLSAHMGSSPQVRGIARQQAKKIQATQKKTAEELAKQAGLAFKKQGEYQEYLLDLFSDLDLSREALLKVLFNDNDLHTATAAFAEFPPKEMSAQDKKTYKGPSGTTRFKRNITLKGNPGVALKATIEMIEKTAKDLGSNRAAGFAERFKGKYHKAFS